MQLPTYIPIGARIVVRTLDGVDTHTGHQQYRDFVGHVRSWDGHILELNRDASANGARPAQEVTIQAKDIAVIKPIPERPVRNRP